MPPKMVGIKSRVEFVKPKPATVQLLDRQLSAADPDVRKVGIVSIPKIQAPVEPLLDCIAAKLEHENWYVRRAGAEAAVKSIESKGAGKPTVEDLLGKRLASDDAEVRRCAAAGLAGIVAAAVAPEPSDLIPPLIAEAAAQQAGERLTDSSAGVRCSALQALVRMGEHARPFAGACLQRLGDEDLSVRREAVQLCTDLGVVAADGAAEAAALLMHEDPAIRRSAANGSIALAAHSGAQVATAVAAALGRCKDAVGRRWILLLIAELGPIFAPHGRVIAEQLSDPDVGVRVSVAKALFAAGPGAADSSLVHVKKRTTVSDRDVQRTAIDCMRAMALICPSYAQVAGKLLTEEDEGTTAAEAVQNKLLAYRVLGGAGANASPFFEEISDGLEDSDWGVRRAAMEAFEDLGEHAQDAAWMVAKRLLHHEPDVRRAAAQCLGSMGVNAGPYASRVEAVCETEEDEDVLKACQEAYKMLQESGVFDLDFEPLPDSPKLGQLSRQ